MLLNYRTRRFRNSILNKQKDYHKLRRRAHAELAIIEEYFGSRTSDKLTIYTDIINHLKASQKHIAYTGFRGILLGLVTTIFVYLFTKGVINNLLDNKGTYQVYTDAIPLIIAISLIVIIFLAMYFLGTSHFFLDDNKRRNQLYINEYIIHLLEGKISEIKDSGKNKK